MFYAGILAKHQTTMHAFCMHFFIYISRKSVTMNSSFERKRQKAFIYRLSGVFSV